MIQDLYDVDNYAKRNVERMTTIARIIRKQSGNVFRNLKNKAVKEFIQDVSIL